MDRTSIIVIICCVALLLLWPQLVRKMYPPKPVATHGLTNQVATPGAATNVGATNGVPRPPLVITAATSTVPATPLLWTNQPEQTLTTVHEGARYTFTSHGGGLKLIELLHYPETVPTRRERKRDAPQRLATLNTRAPLPTLAILGDPAVFGDGIFQLMQVFNGVRAEKTLPNGLRIVKEFRPTTNYLVAATVRLENRGETPLTLPQQEWIVGTATPMGPDDDGSAVGLMWYDGRKSQEIGASHFSPHGFMCMPRTPPIEYRGGNSNVVWAAAHNQFFALAAMPAAPAWQVITRPVALPRPTGEDLKNGGRINRTPTGYETVLLYPATTLAAGQSLEQHVFVFAGPKEYRTLARLATQFENNVDAIMGYGGFFGGFARALLLAMNWLHDMLKLSYGWAIVVITIIIKILFWPLTQASTRSMKRMAALQPQMKAIQDKYKDDPAKMNKKLMEFMKEHRVSPLGGCLPMLLQMPVFIGFFYMIRSAIELRGARFLWVSDLSKPDTLFVIPGINFPFNLLPLLMGATMLWQARMTPVTPGADPVQQKIMKYMPLIFLVFLYNFSAGLTLYWTVQNLLTIAQMKLTKSQPESAPDPARPAAAPPPRKKH